MPVRKSERRDPAWILGILAALALSLLLHGVLLAVLLAIGVLRAPPPPDPAEIAAAAADDEPVNVSVLDALSDPTEDEPTPEEAEEAPLEVAVLDARGQIVDLPPPLKVEQPDRADYLAEQARRVERETMSERFKHNPEVLASIYSRESALEFADVLDLGVTEPSSGARAGAFSFDRDQDGPAADPQAMFAVTNKEGLERPVPASHLDQRLAGAPNNDYLEEESGPGVNLNTREFKFAGYINRIRQLVDFYWQQNLDNLPGGLRLGRSQYQTVVDVALTQDGALERVEVTSESGVVALDDCVVRAFQMAGPFPNPPAQLVGPDGRAVLPDFGFVVRIGMAQSTYRGIDPRAGVQFPGILKASH